VPVVMQSLVTVLSFKIALEVSKLLGRGEETASFPDSLLPLLPISIFFIVSLTPLAVEEGVEGTTPEVVLEEEDVVVVE